MPSTKTITNCVSARQYPTVRPWYTRSPMKSGAYAQSTMKPRYQVRKKTCTG